MISIGALRSSNAENSLVIFLRCEIIDLNHHSLSFSSLKTTKKIARYLCGNGNV
jgi:hypothetical protein